MAVILRYVCHRIRYIWAHLRHSCCSSDSYCLQQNVAQRIYFSMVIIVVPHVPCENKVRLLSILSYVLWCNRVLKVRM